MLDPKGGVRGTAPRSFAPMENARVPGDLFPVDPGGRRVLAHGKECEKICASPPLSKPFPVRSAVAGSGGPAMRTGTPRVPVSQAEGG